MLLVTAGVIALLRSSIFAVSFVEVQIEKSSCSDPDQIKNSSGLLGQNIFLLNSAKLQNDLKNKFLCIRRVEVKRFFPNKLKLSVSVREPAATLVVLQDEEATESADILSEASPSAENFVIDNEGVIYSSNTEQVIAPKVYVSSLNLTLGQKINEDLIGNLLRILERVKSSGVDIKEAKIYSKNVLLVNDTAKIIFRLDDKIDTQIASLQLILQKAKIDEDILEFIDLRFDKPIIRFAPKKNGQR